MRIQPIFFVQQNTVCLEQQIYASQEQFTQLLIVLVETFRKSAFHREVLGDSKVVSTRKIRFFQLLTLALA